MNVFVLQIGWMYEGAEIIGIYTDRAMALKAIATHINKHSPGLYFWKGDRAFKESYDNYGPDFYYEIKTHVLR